MDNNYNYGAGGFEPSKPFTEKQGANKPDGETPVQNSPADMFTKPQNTAQAPSKPQPQTVPHTENAVPAQNVDYSQVSYARYENPVCDNFEPQKPFSPDYRSNGVKNTAQNFSQPQYRNNPPYRNMNNSGYNSDFAQPNYGQPVYGNQPQQMQYNNYQPNVQGYPNNFNNQPYGVPQMPGQNFGNGYTYNNQYQPNIQNPVMPRPKKKLGVGIIVLLVVLGVLFVGSLVGIIVFAFNQDDDNRNPDSSYSFTLPDSDDYQYDSNLASDYSDKVNPSYEGLKLEQKPGDTSNSKYNAEYSNSVVCDSVVAILCYDGEIDDSDYYASQGSGIIITSDGYVVTNSHVINDSKTDYSIQIVTSDDKEYTAGVVGYDSRTDLALLKMDNAENLKVATFGDSSQIALGEEVIVVGNPGGIEYSNSVTKGIISAVDREISTTNATRYIQTDAPINPGNSGGPVVNMYGQVIGIATAKIASTDYEGMGFAIPSQDVKKIIDELMKNGYVSGRVKIGITGYNVTSQEAAANNVPQGIIIESIASGGPCDGSGLEKEDIITAADGKDVKSFSDLFAILSEYKSGDEITLTYYRMDDGSKGEVKITLQEDKS